MLLAKASCEIGPTDRIVNTESGLADLYDRLRQMGVARFLPCSTEIVSFGNSIDIPPIATGT